MPYPDKVTRIVEPLNWTAVYGTFGLGSAIKSTFLTSITKLALGGIGTLNLLSTFAPGRGTSEKVFGLIKTATIYYAGFIDGLLEVVGNSKTIIAPAMQILTCVFAYRTKLAFKGDDIIEKFCAAVMTAANQTGVIALLVENDNAFTVSCFTTAGAGLCLTLSRANKQCRERGDVAINSSIYKELDDDSSSNWNP